MYNFFPIIKRLLPSGRAYFLANNTQHKQAIEALAEEPNRICTFFNDVKLSGIPYME